MNPPPQEAFADILQELQQRPIHDTERSLTFGVVAKRCLPPDYSRLCWLRPKLYYHLLEFGKKHVDISFNSITIQSGEKEVRYTFPKKSFLCKDKQGNFYTLTFYLFQNNRSIPLPLAQVKIENEKYIFYRGEQRVIRLQVKGRKKECFSGITKEIGTFIVKFE